MSHYQKDETQFFYSLNSAQLQNKYVETGYSIISKHLSPETTKSDFISTQLLCSNRDLPHEALSQANNILNLNDSSLARRAVVLKRPNKPYYFEQNKNVPYCSMIIAPKVKKLIESKNSFLK